MSKKQNGNAAAVKSANNTSNAATPSMADNAEKEQLIIETLDTRAMERIERWRKHAEAYINKIKDQKAFDEIRVMAKKRLYCKL